MKDPCPSVHSHRVQGVTPCCAGQLDLQRSGLQPLIAVMSWDTQGPQADEGHSTGLEPTPSIHRGVGTSMLQLGEQHVQWALLSAWTHPNPFPGGGHRALTSAGLDADMSWVVADPWHPGLATKMP